jgi:hypothetical protein
MRAHHESGRVFGSYAHNLCVVDPRQGQLLRTHPPPGSHFNFVIYLLSFLFIVSPGGELLPSGAYQEVEMLRIDGDLLAFQAKRSDSTHDTTRHTHTTHDTTSHRTRVRCEH